MKKTIKSLSLCLAVISLSSCYTSKTAVGNMSLDAPSVKVNTMKNNALIAGLVPLGKGHQAKQFIGDRTNYVVKSQMTFVDGLLGAITLGIYTPTTTTLWVPLDEVKK